MSWNKNWLNPHWIKAQNLRSQDPVRTDLVTNVWHENQKWKLTIIARPRPTFFNKKNIIISWIFGHPTACFIHCKISWNWPYGREIPLTKCKWSAKTVQTLIRAQDLHCYSGQSVQTLRKGIRALSWENLLVVYIWEYKVTDQLQVSWSAPMFCLINSLILKVSSLGCTAWFVSGLSGNPKDRFPHNT